MLNGTPQRLTRLEPYGFRCLHPDGFPGTRIAPLACCPFCNPEGSEANQLDFLVLLQRRGNGRYQIIQCPLSSRLVTASRTTEMTEIRCSLSLTPAGVALGALGRAFFGVEADFALVDRFAGARAMMSSPPECGVFLNLENSSHSCSQWLRYRNGISRSFPFGQASFIPERCEALIQMSDEKSLFIKKR